MDDGDVLVVSSGDRVVNGMLLDEGNLVARSARSRWFGLWVLARWSSARARRGSVEDELTILDRNQANEYVRVVRIGEGKEEEPKSGGGVTWWHRNHH
jgi:hypothetical protein